MATFYVPAPYLPAPTGTGGLDGLLLAAAAILVVAAAVIGTLVLLNRPARKTTGAVSAPSSGDLRKAA